MKSDLVNHRKSVADLSLDSAAGAFSFGRRRGSIILVLVDHDTCAACHEFIDRLVEENTELAVWDAALAIVTPVAKATSTEVPAVSVLYDPDHRLEQTAGIKTPGIVIVDQWSDITEARAAGVTHEFPAVTDIIASVRYLATQCPECEGETL